MKTNLQEMEHVKRLTYERAWLTVPTRHAPAWAETFCTSTARMYEGKKFIAWYVKNGQPRIVELYMVTGLSITCDGPSMTLQTSHGSHIQIGHKPTALAGNALFAWFPAFMDVRYTPRNYDESDSRHRRLTWWVCIRSRMELKDTPVEGVTYFSGVTEFNNLWPDVTF